MLRWLRLQAERLGLVAPRRGRDRRRANEAGTAGLTAICVRHHEPVVEPDPDLADLHLVRLLPPWRT